MGFKRDQSLKERGVRNGGFKRERVKSRMLKVGL